MTAIHKLEFKDGDDGSVGTGILLTISGAENGYILTVTDDEGDEVFVYTHRERLIDALKEIL